MHLEGLNEKTGGMDFQKDIYYYVGISFSRSTTRDVTIMIGCYCVFIKCIPSIMTGLQLIGREGIRGYMQGRFELVGGLGPKSLVGGGAGGP